MSEIDPQSVSVARLRPGDVLVFRCPDKLTPKQQTAAAATLEAHFGDVPILILDGGQALEIVRPEPAPSFWRRFFGGRDG